MQTVETTITEATRSMTNKEMVVAIISLQAQVKALEEKLSAAVTVRNTTEREMTDDDARRILNGDLKDTKHKDAAAQLGLSYGQVYSCRGEYTFKAIHKELAAKGFTNPWKK